MTCVCVCVVAGAVSGPFFFLLLLLLPAACGAAQTAGLPGRFFPRRAAELAAVGGALTVMGT